MSAYRKIYFPKCPYCGMEVKSNLGDYNYGKLVSMAIGTGTDDVVLICARCDKSYRVTCTIKFYAKKQA